MEAISQRFAASMQNTHHAENQHRSEISVVIASPYQWKIRPKRGENLFLAPSDVLIPSGGRSLALDRIFTRIAPEDQLYLESREQIIAPHHCDAAQCVFFGPSG